MGNKDFELEGAAPVLEKCPCCGYRTIKEKGAYEICRVCFWEDDRKDDRNADSFSHVNHIALKEARDNFIKTGACSADAKEFVDKKGTLKFAKA